MSAHEKWTSLKILTWTQDFLFSKGIINARLEAEWLLCSAMGLDRVGLYLHYEKPLNVEELALFRVLVARRGRREPLQHILGSQEFCGLDYEVTADVLIPRHDTEILVTEAVRRQPDAITILDIGTGSGCIAISLQKLLSNAIVTATDISDAALVVARRNANKNKSPIEFILGNLFEPLAGRYYDLIVSNPPYIPTADIDQLDLEVKKYDPRTALDGGNDGLDIYRLLIPSAAKYLNPEGWLLLEVGIGQAKNVECLFNSTGSYNNPIITCDYSGIERVVGAQLKEMV